MSKPGIYSTFSTGLPVLSREPHRHHGNDRSQVLIRTLQGLLLVAFLSLIIAGAIYAFDQLDAGRSLFGSTAAHGAEISPISNQADKAKDGAAPATTPGKTGTEAGGVVVYPPKSNTANPPTAKTADDGAATNVTPGDAGAAKGGAVGQPDEVPAVNIGISVLVNRKHSLPASYAPANLVAVRARMRPNITSDEKLMQPEAAKALENMMQKAEQDGIILYAASGYRSYATQQAIYEWRVQAQGQAVADLYTAHPGQSEHQTGLAMDLSDKSGELEETFAQTPEGKWLAANAQDFGFILRYPQGKESITGYNYEPWHFRYVGITAAKEIKAKGLVYEEYLK